MDHLHRLWGMGKLHRLTAGVGPLHMLRGGDRPASQAVENGPASQSKGRVDQLHKLRGMG